MKIQQFDKITDQSEAEKEISTWKLRMPFRNWCGIELLGSWEIHDSIRSAKREWKKLSKPCTKMLVYGKD